jgi:hypothetical protein
MDSQIVLLCFALISFFFILDKRLSPLGRLDKEHIIADLEKNKKRDLAFLKQLESLVASNNAWSLNAFSIGDITFEEYIDALREKFAAEYSASELEKVKSAKLSSKHFQEYRERIVIQNDANAAYHENFVEQQILILRKNAS